METLRFYGNVKIYGNVDIIESLKKKTFQEF